MTQSTPDQIQNSSLSTKNNPDEPAKQPGRHEHPLSQAGLSSLIIGLSALVIEDENWVKFCALISPILSYGVLNEIKAYRRRQKLKKLCDVIDKAILELEIEKRTLQNKQRISAVDKNTIAAIERKIQKLREKKQSHMLDDVDIKLEVD